MKKISKLVPDDDIDIKLRDQRVEELNQIMQDECSTLSIAFCNIFDIITTNDIMHLIFYLSHNPSNVHHRYEYLLLVYLHTCFPWLKKELNMEKLIRYMEKRFQ